MGRRVCALVEHDDRFSLNASIDRSSPPGAASADARLGPVGIDVVVDFSADAGAREAASIAVRSGAALLVGTTGLSAETLDVLGESARSVAVMIAPNTSLGVAVLAHLASEAARLLGDAYQVDLVEAHHRHKRDAPSGTALRLKDAVESSCGGKLPGDRVHCIRAGEIIGEHELRFTGPRDRLVLSHAALDRDLFAAGALDAAAWLAGRGPGRYRIEQTLGLAPG